MNIRSWAALVIAKTAGYLIKSFKLGSATSLPGKLALQIAPNLLYELNTTLVHRSIVITGTNGKSTTAGLISQFGQSNGRHVVHNHLGANMITGITTTLIHQTSLLSQQLQADMGVFEVDEASLPGCSPALKPTLTVVTNLFRDQLDRYGELDTTAQLIQRGLQAGGGKVLLNADDPMVTSIGHHLPDSQVAYFGMQQVTYPNHHLELDALSPVGFPKEVTDCPLCQEPLEYSQFIYGHLGHYTCLNCGFKRPTPVLSALKVHIGQQGSQLTLCLNDHTVAPIECHLPGLYNAYNVLAAVAAATWFGLDFDGIQSGLKTYQGIFGRAEHKVIRQKDVQILLIKNPAGAGEVLKVVSGDPNARIHILINDDYADGRDISWLWDAPFELLAQNQNPICVSGHRAEDMRLRLYYAGIPEDRILCDPDPLTAFYRSLEQTPKGQTLYVLPTYTALLSLSQALQSR